MRVWCPVPEECLKKKDGIPCLNTNWDKRFALEDPAVWSRPSVLLRDYIGLFPSGRALDVASGPGRNAAFLARRGFIVDAVDNSREGLRMADRLLRGSLGGGDIRDRVNLIQADLTEYVIRIGRYDLIVNFYYLDRGLVDSLIAGLKEGGYLVFETFTKNHIGYTSRSNPDHYLDENELLGLCRDLHIVFYREGTVIENRQVKAVAQMIARK